MWDKNTVTHLYAHKESSGKEACYTVGSSIVAEKINVSADKVQLIEILDLVDFIQKQNRKIDLIKLDVEGAEIAILKKIITAEAWHLFDRMYVETHETKIPSQAKELDWIKSQLKERNIRHIKFNWV